MATNFVLSSQSSASSSSSSGSSDDEGYSANTFRKMDMSYQEFNGPSLDVYLNQELEDEMLEKVEKVYLYNNNLDCISNKITQMINLQVLDLSNNMIRDLPDEIMRLKGLTNLYLRNNLLTDHSFPKNFHQLTNLRDLNLSGNRLTEIPQSVCNMSSLRNLFVGGNLLTEITPAIRGLIRLRVFYLGGNIIKSLPPDICHLTHLHALILCENRLKSLPDEVCSLRKLECLQLHSNRITILPHGLIHLRSLNELSLRDNPLVHKFVREMEYQPSSLLELAARIVKTNPIHYESHEIPVTLIRYLNSSHGCLNPQCNGVYFNTRVEHVKFVDFCGKYKIPLMQYLCSSKCKDDKPVHPIKEDEPESGKMKRILLG